MVSPLSLNRSIQLSFYVWEGRSEILETLKICQESISKKGWFRLIIQIKTGL